MDAGSDLPSEWRIPVVRYAKEHKQATRQRIIETAGHRFKQDGIDGSGVATLMADAGLTNGAFYAHFESKDDLVANVVADQLRAQAETFSTLPPGRAGLEEFLRDYLSPQHRDNPAAGCPSAALLDGPHTVRRSGSLRWRWERCSCPAPCPIRRSPTTSSNGASRTPSRSFAERPHRRRNSSALSTNCR
jgi:AcrR family transcriptional regulator